MIYREPGDTGVASVMCGACEKRCPFGVGIMENMKRAKEVFGV